MFIYVSAICENKNAAEKLEALGKTMSACDDPEEAVEECFKAENWNGGWICSITAEMFKNMGVNTIAKTRANFTDASKKLYPSLVSSYTRCVYEIVAGNVDICVADFWETASRRKLVGYTAAFDQDTQRLLTMPKGGAAAANPNQAFSLKDINAAAMTGWMRPFDIWVWMATVGYFIFGALICWAVEGSAGNEDYLVDGNMSGLSAVQSVWGGFLDFFLGGPSVLTAVTWPGRFCLFGYTLFIFITVSMYTANLVNFMVSVPVIPKLVTTLQVYPSQEHT